MGIWLTSVTLSLLSSALSALAQPNVPQSIMWQRGDQATSHQASVSGAISADISSPTVSPVTTAHNVAVAIAEDLYAGRVQATNVAVIMRGFGTHEEPPATQDGSAKASFFHATDRLAGLNEFSLQQFPQPRSLDPEHDHASARSYYHPFLYNASHFDAPLRLWMIDFVNALESEYHARLETPTVADNIPDPNNYRFIFDNEVFGNVMPPLDDNGVYLLRFLAESSLWDSAPVPGYHDKTLAQLYAEERAAHQNTAEWPDSILEQAGGLHTGINFDLNRDNNAQFMLWYYSICQGALDTLMNNCAYSILHDARGTPGQPGYFRGWPHAKTSNWDAIRTDAQIDTFSWFYDYDGTGNGRPMIPGQAYPFTTGGTPPQLSTAYPRLFMGRSPGIGLMDSFNLEDGNREDRSGAFECWTSADMQSPNLYPINLPAIFDGYALSSTVHQRGLRQLNPYVAPSLIYPVVNTSSAELDSESYSELVLDRMVVESAINSVGGQHQDELAPWLQQNRLWTADGPIVSPYKWYRRQQDLAALVALLRAKQVPELLWFTGDEDYRGVDYRMAWNATADLVGRVYEPYIATANVLAGSASTPPSGETVPSLLETTLRRDNGSERQLVVTAAHGVGDSYSTSVKVEFAGLENYRMFDFLVYVECSAATGVIGGVSVENHRTGNFDPVRIYESTKANPITEYDFRTPDGKSIRAFRVPYDPVDNVYVKEGTMTLLLQHWGAGPFTSKYDLVQIVPQVKLFTVPTNEEFDIPEVWASPPGLVPSGCTPPPPSVGPSGPILNSDFSNLTPTCSTRAGCRGIVLKFSAPVSIPAGNSKDAVPVYVRKLDATVPFNYADFMDIQIKTLSDAGWSDEIVLRGDGHTLLLPGVYEVTPITGTSPAEPAAGTTATPIALPLWDRTFFGLATSGAAASESVDPVPLTTTFAYQFELISDCDLDGVPDSEQIAMAPGLDLNQNGIIDSCECFLDYNLDGNVDQGDLDCVIAAIAGDTALCGLPANVFLDFNEDGSTDQADVSTFATALSSGVCDW